MGWRDRYLATEPEPESGGWRARYLSTSPTPPEDEWEDLSPVLQRNRKTGETRPKAIPGGLSAYNEPQQEEDGLLFASPATLAARRAGGKRALAAAGEAVATIADLPALAAKGLAAAYLPTGVEAPSYETIRRDFQPGVIGKARRAVSAFDQQAAEQQLEAEARAGASPLEAALSETAAFGVGNAAAMAVPADLGVGKVARLARGARAVEEATLPAVRAAEEGVQPVVRAVEGAAQVAEPARAALPLADAEQELAGRFADFLRSKGLDEDAYFALPEPRQHLLDAEFEVRGAPEVSAEAPEAPAAVRQAGQEPRSAPEPASAMPRPEIGPGTGAGEVAEAPPPAPGMTRLYRGHGARGPGAAHGGDLAFTTDPAVAKIHEGSGGGLVYLDLPAEEAAQYRVTSEPWETPTPYRLSLGEHAVPPGVAARARPLEAQPSWGPAGRLTEKPPRAGLLDEPSVSSNEPTVEAELGPAAPEPRPVVREGLFQGQEEPLAPAVQRPEPPLGPRHLPEPVVESEPLPGMEPSLPGLTTGTKHAVTRAERLAAGLPEVENVARKDSETWAAAKEIFERDPEAPRTLAQHLAAKPRPISDVENDLLLHDRMQMTLDHRDAMAAEEAALQAGDSEGIALARLRRQSIEQAKDANDRALDLGGSESGRALRARQKLIAEDYSPLNLVQRYRVANLGEEAPAPVRQKLAEISAQLEQAQARAAAAEERAQELEALRLIRSEQGAAAKATRSGRRAVSRQELDAEYSALSQAFAKRAATPRAGLDPELAGLIAKMAKNRVRAGSTNLADLVDSIYQETKPYLAELEPRDVRDVIAGAGPTAQKAARTKAVSELAQIRREARVLNALDDARAKLASPNLTPASRKALEREAFRWEVEAEKLSAGTAAPRVGPASDPQRLAAAKVRAAQRVAELQEQIVSGTVPTKGRAPIAADAELLNARAQVRGLQRQADTIIRRREMANRSGLEKGMDWTAGWGRFLKLTGTATLQKITAAASERALVFKPVEELIGAGLSKLPVVSRVAAKAPIEGGGSMSAIAKSYGAFFGDQARAEIRAGLAGRETPMELAFKSHAAYGEKVPAWMEYPGRMHAALKSPARVAGYQYAMEKQAQWYLGRGEADMLLNPVAQEEMKARAWEYAQRDIFMGDNAAVRAFNKALGSEPGESLVAKGGKTAGRVLLPIVKVPTNYALEVTDYALGLPKGMARLGGAVRKGLDELPAAEAEQIMRQLKKGSLGAGLIALGATGVVEAGGYYVPGEHRRHGELEAGEVKIAGVTIPHMLLHHPAVEALQIGAAIHRERELAAGLGNAAWGVAEQVPFFEEPISAARTLRSDPSRFFGSIERGMTIPPDIQRAARVLDQRRPRTPGQMAAQQAGWGGLSVEGAFEVPEIETRKRKARGDFLEQLWEEELLGVPFARKGVR